MSASDFFCYQNRRHSIPVSCYKFVPQQHSCSLLLLVVPFVCIHIPSINGLLPKRGSTIYRTCIPTPSLIPSTEDRKCDLCPTTKVVLLWFWTRKRDCCTTAKSVLALVQRVACSLPLIRGNCWHTSCTRRIGLTLQEPNPNPKSTRLAQSTIGQHPTPSQSD